MVFADEEKQQQHEQSCSDVVKQEHRVKGRTSTQIQTRQKEEEEEINMFRFDRI